MRRLRDVFPLRFACLAPLAGLAACAAASQSASNPAAYAQVVGTAQSLVGATPAALSAEFGQPAILRVDGPAEVWLYHNADCGLNLILYPDAAGTPRVAMVSATDGSAVPTACMASLQQAHLDEGATLPATAALPGPTDAALERPASS